MKRMILVGLMVSVSAVAGQPVQPPPGSALLLKAVEISFPTQGQKSHRRRGYLRQADRSAASRQPTQSRPLAAIR